jgi:hypothetical protein
MAKRFTYEFEWDPNKARDNLRKHRVAFERAATIFLDPEALSVEMRIGGLPLVLTEQAYCWLSAIVP